MQRTSIFSCLNFALGLPRLGQGTVGKDHHIGFQLGFERINALQLGFRHFHRRQLSSSDPLGDIHETLIVQLPRPGPIAAPSLPVPDCRRGQDRDSSGKQGSTGNPVTF